MVAKMLRVLAQDVSSLRRKYQVSQINLENTSKELHAIKRNTSPSKIRVTFATGDNLR